MPRGPHGGISSEAGGGHDRSITSSPPQKNAPVRCGPRLGKFSAALIRRYWPRDYPTTTLPVRRYHAGFHGVGHRDRGGVGAAFLVGMHAQHKVLPGLQRIAATTKPSCAGAAVAPVDRRMKTPAAPRPGSSVNVANDAEPRYSAAEWPARYRAGDDQRNIGDGQRPHLLTCFDVGVGNHDICGVITLSGVRRMRADDSGSRRWWPRWCRAEVLPSPQLMVAVYPLAGTGPTKVASTAVSR